MTSDGQQSQECTTPTWLAPRNPQLTTWISLDANPHQIRLVVVTDSLILGAFEARSGPRQAARTIQFIRNTVPVDAKLKLVGRYHDRWPPQLQFALVKEFGPVTWIYPPILNVTLEDVERWHRLFKTYRALFFAICAEEDAKRTLSPFFSKFEILCAWKNAVLNDLTANYTYTA